MRLGSSYIEYRSTQKPLSLRLRLFFCCSTLSLFIHLHFYVSVTVRIMHCIYIYIDDLFYELSRGISCFFNIHMVMVFCFFDIVHVIVLQIEKIVHIEFQCFLFVVVQHICFLLVCIFIIQRRFGSYIFQRLSALDQFVAYHNGSRRCWSLERRRWTSR